jgi:CubicO group peptidase (beta-lactamase class C family)
MAFARLAAIAVLALGVSRPLGAQARDTLGLRPAFRLIDQYATQSMQGNGTPGLALALVDRKGLITVRTYGYADLERGIAVTPPTRFEIGSISKSFTAIALLQLADSGRFDPNRSARSYLPWFTPTTRYRAITAHDLLTHTSGLPRDRDDIPSSPAQAYLARERTTGSAPGTHYAYSNIGYQVLGVLLESLVHQPYQEIIRQRILDPLGLRGASPQITHSGRLALAKGYEKLYDDRPARPDDPLVEATWIEYGSGDGALVMTAPELGTYLTMLLNRGVGPNGRILSDAGFDRLTRPQVSADHGTHYGYGIVLGTLDGRPVFGHSGGMLGFSSYLIGEPSLGVGAVALVNGPGSAGAVARFALRALNAAMRGESLPPLPQADSPHHVDRPERYTGTYTSPTGATLRFESAADSLFLVQGDARVALAPYDDDAFLGPVESYPLFPLRFAGDSSGMSEVWYGSEWYVGERYRGPRSFTAPAEWTAFPGHYRIMQPWEPNFRIVLRKGRLWYVSSDGSEESLTPLPGGEFRVGEENSAERLRFGDVVDGKALTATFSGMRYFRFFTP